jgi:hypothetical protein
MAFEILTATKEELKSEADVRKALADARPGAKIENIVLAGDEWTIRLAEVPAFLKEKGEESAPDDEASESPEEEAKEDSGEKKDDDAASKEKGDGKEKGGSPAQAVEKVITELQSLLKDLGGNVKALQDSHDEKDQALKEISDAAGEHGGGDMAPPLPEDVGPVPGGPPAGAGAPPGAIPPVPQGPRGPSKRPRPGGAPLNAFTHRRTEVATHPGVDAEGNRITLLAAATELEKDPELQEYEVVGMVENRDGTYSAKLKLKTD